MALPTSFMFVAHWERRPSSMALFIAGTSMARRSAMSAITTRSSTRVNASPKRPFRAITHTNKRVSLAHGGTDKRTTFLLHSIGLTGIWAGYCGAYSPNSAIARTQPAAAARRSSIAQNDVPLE